MSFIDKLSARLPFTKKEEELEYYFALNIAEEVISVALWTLEGKHLKILETASSEYTSVDEITPIADKLLDAVLGIREADITKILFGVPHSWLQDDSLKDEYLKVLRGLVKELELTPMAYVSTANALINFLEKAEGILPTAILVGFEKNYVSITVVRAGKLDGVKLTKRGESSGADLEKALLTFTSVETLPSKILIYDSETNLEKLKTQLLSFSWMNKLSFLHFPKIDILTEHLEIKSVCLAGATEINSDVLYTDQNVKISETKPIEIIPEESIDQKEAESVDIPREGDNFGFVVGDVSRKMREEEEKEPLDESTNLLETDDFETEKLIEQSSQTSFTKRFNFKKFIPKKLFKSPLFLGGVAILLILLGMYIFIPKANVKIFVEPKILEKDAQVIADPNQKLVDENAKIIPGKIVETEVSGSSKDSASGKKEVGNSAKGTVKIINNTDKGQNFAAGTILTSSGGLKFKLDKTASVSATPADADSKSTVTVQATAVDIGPDSNLPSGTNLTITNFSSSQFVAKAEGGITGGTSQTVTVVSSDDQKRLLAKLSSDLRSQAQQKLQEQLKDQKILQEALAETIIRKSYNKNIGDQASEFSLNLSASYKGTAYNDVDLRLIVSKLVTTQVPDGFALDISATETQADVSSVEKSGKVIFLAKFKAKLLPKIDTEKVKKEILGKSVKEAEGQIKGMENVLGSEIKISPNLPSLLQRIPFLKNHINLEVGLK